MIVPKARTIRSPFPQEKERPSASPSPDEKQRLDRLSMPKPSTTTSRARCDIDSENLPTAQERSRGWETPLKNASNGIAPEHSCCFWRGCRIPPLRLLYLFFLGVLPPSWNKSTSSTTTRGGTYTTVAPIRYVPGTLFSTLPFLYCP